MVRWSEMREITERGRCSCRVGVTRNIMLSMEFVAFVVRQKSKYQDDVLYRLRCCSPGWGEWVTRWIMITVSVVERPLHILQYLCIDIS